MAVLLRSASPRMVHESLVTAHRIGSPRWEATMKRYNITVTVSDKPSSI